MVVVNDVLTDEETIVEDTVDLGAVINAYFSMGFISLELERKSLIANRLDEADNFFTVDGPIRLCLHSGVLQVVHKQASYAFRFEQ